MGPSFSTLIPNEIKVLNASALRIWKLSDGTRRSEEITSAVASSFESVPQSVGEDVTEFIRTMVEVALGHVESEEDST